MTEWKNLNETTFSQRLAELLVYAKEVRELTLKDAELKIKQLTAMLESMKNGRMAD